MNVQDMACPVCGKMVGGFETGRRYFGASVREPDRWNGYSTPGGDYYVVQKQGMTWMVPESHTRDGEWCEGSGSLCYVGDANL